MTAATTPLPIGGDEALQIARADAERVYRELHLYRIEIMLETDGWHIDYELKDTQMNGGGPHYVIDATTGEIVAKRYYQ